MTAMLVWVLVPTLLFLATLLYSVLIGRRTKDLEFRGRSSAAEPGRRGVLVNVVRTDRPGA